MRWTRRLAVGFYGRWNEKRLPRRDIVRLVPQGKEIRLTPLGGGRLHHRGFDAGVRKSYRGSWNRRLARGGEIPGLQLAPLSF